MSNSLRRTLLRCTWALPLLLGCAGANVRAGDTDAMLTNYIKALNANMPPRNNPEAVANLFTPDGVQRHGFGEPPEGPQRGREAIGKFFAGFDAMLKTWEHVESTRTVQAQRAVWEGVAQGIHKDSGKFVKIPIVFFIEFNDEGKVKEERVYLNPALFEAQIK
jgi:ketosteroid isomerase-like protein